MYVIVTVLGCLQDLIAEDTHTSDRCLGGEELEWDLEVSSLKLSLTVTKDMKAARQEISQSIFLASCKSFEPQG